MGFKVVMQEIQKRLCSVTSNLPLGVFLAHQARQRNIFNLLLIEELFAKLVEGCFPTTKIYKNILDPCALCNTFLH